MKSIAIPLACLGLVAAKPALADEGMWTFDNFPLAKVNAAYGLGLDTAWLNRLQTASVRLTTGCSASLVSGDGLALTNHHCVVECAQDLSSPAQDYVKSGFLTASRAEERACPGLQAEILTTTSDVTAKIRDATRSMSGDAFTRARDAAIATQEELGCSKDEMLRCEVVSLYRGGQYKLYKYRRYSDVRLVFAPELASAFFGGDPDNFNFPRFSLDASFLRLYEGGKPVATPQHLIWAPRAPLAGEATFVSGNPGGTDRTLTVGQLETQRDLTLPIAQLQRSELRGRLIRFSEEGPEARRIATDPLFGIENAFKVAFGRQFALNDRAFLDTKRRAEAELKARVAAAPTLVAEIGDPWSEIDAAQTAYAENYLRYRQIEQAAGSLSNLFDYARTLVRAAQEIQKPSPDRLPEFGEARLKLVEKQLLAPKPVDAPLEQLYLAFWLSKTREYLTADEPAVRLLLGKESPEALAARLVRDSQLSDPAVRKALWTGGVAAIQASKDPLIQLALRLDPDARAARAAWETKVSGPIDRAAERIARARFAVYGDEIYPDATFTLRLSYGQVAGWTYRGQTIAPSTTFAGLYDRATGSEPFQLPARWTAAKGKVDPSTVFNFVTTNDIIGGNSGSPVVNAAGEVLGAVFDGNIHSLGGNYGYDGAINRTVAVSTAAVTEALTKVYGQTGLVRELTTTQRVAR
ncbi:S46 family peptidase [Phenylobacterium sp.]|uniref:S46 family peptidase n=1 Tax=Phenylobacterium sp. TaxID=1871053 RepID=UPI0037CB8BA5